MAKIQEDIINSSLPGELKKQGVYALIVLVTNLAMKFAEKIIPALEKQLIKLEGDCPTPEELVKVVNIRNNVLDQANTISKILKGITFTVGLSKLGIDTLVKLIIALKTAKITASLAAKLLPVVPGAVPAAISDLDDIITEKTFDRFGNPKIPPTKFALDSISVPLALMSFYINEFIIKLNSLDDKIKNCNTDPNLDLPLPSSELVEISKAQKQAEESPNLSEYQGFIFEIEEVPFSPTVNRKRALGKNQDGITLIQTELSFTPSDEVLINELKFIIDRDNLKAY
jgi:hypothetical protein